MGIFNIGIDRIYGRATAAEVNALKGEIEAANRMLHDGSGAGNDFLGWVGLPQEVMPECLKTIGD